MLLGWVFKAMLAVSCMNSIDTQYRVLFSCKNGAQTSVLKYYTFFFVIYGFKEDWLILIYMGIY